MLKNKDQIAQNDRTDEWQNSNSKLIVYNPKTSGVISGQPGSEN